MEKQMLIPLSLSGYICSLGTVTPSIRLPVMKKKYSRNLLDIHRYMHQDHVRPKNVRFLIICAAFCGIFGPEWTISFIFFGYFYAYNIIFRFQELNCSFISNGSNSGINIIF